MSRRNLRAALLALGVAAVMPGCGGAPGDTGFRGKWSRGEDGARVSIWQDGATWRFCWATRLGNDGPVLSCATDGRTEMRENGEKTYEYIVDAREDANPGVLLVRVEGRPVGSRKTPIAWVDRLELQPGGLVILAYMTELNGKPRNPPTGPMRLTKISNDPS